MGGCHGNLSVDGDSLPGLTPDHSYDGSSEPAGKHHSERLNTRRHVTNDEERNSLSVGDDVNARVVEGGGLGEERRDDRHGGRDGPGVTERRPETHQGVRRPGHQEHDDHHDGHLIQTQQQLSYDTVWTIFKGDKGQKKNTKRTENGQKGHK